MDTAPTHRPSRRRLMGAGVVLAVLVAAALVLLARPGGPSWFGGSAETTEPWERDDYRNSGVLGDTDGDGRLDQTERAGLEKTAAAFEVVEEKVAAAKGGHSLLLTPATEQWWEFVTDRMPGLNLDNSPAPQDALWFSHGEGEVFEPASDVHRFYEALHVAFDTPDQARAWVETSAGEGVGSAAMFAVRGPVVTVTPAWADALREPYPMPTAADVEQVQADVALWRIDFDALGRHRAQEASDPVAFQAFWDATGLSGTWEATSPRPDVAWNGRLDGFDVSKVDVEAAVAAVNTSVYQCAKERECRTESGISHAIDYFHLVDSTGLFGGGEAYAPGKVRDDVAVALVLGAPFRGMANETNALVGTEQTTYVVFNDAMLSLTFSDVDPTAETS